MMTLKELRDWIDVAFKIVLAGAGIIVGYYFSFQRQQNEDLRLLLDLATDESPAKRLMSNAVATTFFNDQRLSEELYRSYVFYVFQSPNADLRKAVYETAASEGSQSNLRRVVDAAIASVPPRVYFHIGAESDRAAAITARNLLQSTEFPDGSQIIVPGIELRPEPQSRTNLRCFRSYECRDVAPRIIEALNEMNIFVALSDMSGQYENLSSVRPGHFELWFDTPIKTPSGG